MRQGTIDFCFLSLPPGTNDGLALDLLADLGVYWAERMATWLARRVPSLRGFDQRVQIAARVIDGEEAAVHPRSLTLRSSAGLSSYGGANLAPYIALVIQPHHGQEIDTYPEYEHIRSDPVIGALRARGPLPRLLAETAHEVAHAAYLESLIGRFGPTARDLIVGGAVGFAHHGHNPGWQRFYALLRRRFINSRAEDPLAAAATGWPL